MEAIAVWKIKDIHPVPDCYAKFNSQGQQLGGEQSFDIWTGFEAQPPNWMPGELVVNFGYQFPGQPAPVWKISNYHLSDELSSKPIGYMGALTDPMIVVNYESSHYIGFIKEKFLIPRAQMNGEGKIIVSIETRTQKNIIKEEKSKPLKVCKSF